MCVFKKRVEFDFIKDPNRSSSTDREGGVEERFLSVKGWISYVNMRLGFYYS